MKSVEEDRNSREETERKCEAPRKKKLWKHNWRASKLG